jgi:tetratricopeptide (TPR) repeat protein
VGRVIDRTRIGGDRALVGGNRIANINRGGRFENGNRDARFLTQINRFNRPWWRQDGGWYHGGWGNWPYYPAFWSGLAGGSWLSPWAVGSTFAYDNPYYAASEDVLPELDYANPLPEMTETQVADVDEDTVTAATNHFAQARALFKQGRYADATAEADAAIQLLPSNRTIHEFRALTLFARGMYDQATAGVYAVLAQGPGWDWATMIGLYNSPATYTAQLRALEAFVSDHPRDAAARFLLAYHYFVMDDREAALSQLSVAAKLRPDDKLTAQLIQALTTQSVETLAAPPVPGK